MKLAPWPNTQPIPRLCSINDVCRILQISRSTFQRLDASHDLPIVEATRVGWQRRFTGESVERATRSRWSADARRSA